TLLCIEYFHIITVKTAIDTERVKMTSNLHVISRKKIHFSTIGYAYPEPEGLAATRLKPASAEWIDKNGSAMAVLRYNELRTENDPDNALLDFLRSVYHQSAALGQWPVEQLQHVPDNAQS
ncbi:MAG: DUF5996 family protein, partial [Pseudomonadota bacterium]